MHEVVRFCAMGACGAVYVPGWAHARGLRLGWEFVERVMFCPLHCERPFSCMQAFFALHVSMLWLKLCKDPCQNHYTMAVKHVLPECRHLISPTLVSQNASLSCFNPRRFVEPTAHGCSRLLSSWHVPLSQRSHHVTCNVQLASTASKVQGKKNTLRLQHAKKKYLHQE